MPFFGEGVFTPELKERWLEYYEDVAVLAFPATDGKVSIQDVDEKALYYRAPYSSVPGVKQFLTRKKTFEPLRPEEVVAMDHVVDLTPLLKDGSITWNVPAGEWIVMRFGVRNNGAVTRPAPLPGIGLECDKTDTAALMAHLNTFTGELFRVLGKRDPKSAGGLKILHMDSWEMGAQNWSPSLREEFKKRRGYDPLPYFPVYAGYVVGNEDVSERFLWDLRQTMQDLMLENHALAVKAYAARHGLQLSIEPYDMNPMQDLELGATADFPMCEFWSLGKGCNTTFGAIEAVSVANIKGQRVVPAESFTAGGDGWRQHPASMKNQTDWAFAAGINKLMFHTFQHQCFPDNIRPGVTMGPWGVHWDRNQTWWPYVDAYHRYVARCQTLLQQGMTVADILYLAPEEAPFVFRAPQSALCGDEYMPDRSGYNFDACPPSLLYTASVEDGTIVFPSGMRYRLLVLPDFDRMTPKLLDKIASLIADGATVVGRPPVEAPGLGNYPFADDLVRNLGVRIWGDLTPPKGLVPHSYGLGRVYWGTDLLDNMENLYPNYALTARILQLMDVPVDFSSSDDCVRYIHKQADRLEYYFISNRTKKAIRSECAFRVSGAQPHLWDPLTGETRSLTSFTDDGVMTEIELDFAVNQSYFVVFEPGARIRNTGDPNFKKVKPRQVIDGPWVVRFDPHWGGPDETVFDTLVDWSKSADEGIKYYSGKASYLNTFQFEGKKKGRMYLNLGTVKNIAKVWVNGKELGVVWTHPWRVDITEAVKTGKNELRIDVINLWANRLIGDEFKSFDGASDGKWPEWLLKGEKRPSDRYTFVSHWHYSKDSPLMESGLLGPVSISEEVFE